MLTATIILFILGFVLLAAELLVIPGFGVAGIGGLVSFFLSAYFGFTELGPEVGFIMTGAIIAFVVLMIRFVPRSRGIRRIILRTNVARDGGYVAPPPDLEELCGRRGVALSTLRPSGVAEIGGRRVDVVSDGEFIDPGEAVLVVEVEGSRVVVGRVEDGVASKHDVDKGTRKPEETPGAGHGGENA